MHEMSMHRLMFVALNFFTETKAKGGNDNAGYGVGSGKDTAQMERAQPLADHPLAIDAVKK